MKVSHTRLSGWGRHRCFVIALELIFGEQQAIQRSVAECVRLITCHENGKSFDQQREWLEQIYD
jgi:hypothetical protein